MVDIFREAQDVAAIKYEQVKQRLEETQGRLRKALEGNSNRKKFNVIRSH